MTVLAGLAATLSSAEREANPTIQEASEAEPQEAPSNEEEFITRTIVGTSNEQKHGFDSGPTGTASTPG